MKLMINLLYLSISQRVLHHPIVLKYPFFMFHQLMEKINYQQVETSYLSFYLTFVSYIDSSSYVFEQVDYRNLANSLMYENQVNCWREKQRESSYLVCVFFFKLLKNKSVLLDLDSRSINRA